MAEAPAIQERSPAELPNLECIKASNLDLPEQMRVEVVFSGMGWTRSH